jgi:hypothetical protein
MANAHSTVGIEQIIRFMRKFMWDSNSWYSRCQGDAVGGNLPGRSLTLPLTPSPRPSGEWAGARGFEFKRATSRHGARTWVTLEGMDIGNTFHKDLGLFHGHVMEIYFFGSSPCRLCKTGVEGPTILCGSVPHFSDQSQNRLQMEATFPAARFGRIARPLAPPQRVPPIRPRLAGCGGSDVCGADIGAGEQRNSGNSCVVNPPVNGFRRYERSRCGCSDGS